MVNPYGYGGRLAMNAVSRLLRAPVCTGSGEVLGEVEDMLVNLGSGKVEYISIRSNLKAGSLRVRLSWRDVKVDDAGRVLVMPGASPAKRLLFRARRGQSGESNGGAVSGRAVH